MKKKSVLAVLLASAMALSMTACGSSSSTATDASETPEASAAVSAASEASEAAEAETSEAEEAEAEEDAIPDNDITGDPTADDAFVVWAWNTDFVTLEDLLVEKYPELKDRLVFVNCGGSGYYQDKIDALLDDPTNDLYPDLMLLEVGYVQKYVQSDYLLSLADLGITEADTKDQFAYNIALGSDSNGVQKASFWQATPGCIQIRADLAEKYLGTTDQAELEEIFSSWDSILEAAKTVNDASGGKVKLFSGYDDLKYIYLNGARSVGWYDDNDVIQMDDAMSEYMDYAKELYDQDLTFNTTMWGTDWAALKDGDGETSEACIAFAGCPWYTYWCLTDTWDNNTILVDAPEQFYWGGTGLAATTGCSDTSIAAEIIKACTCDADFMTEIYKANGDFVNNQSAISTIVADDIKGTSTFSLYGDQSIPEFFSTRGQGVDVSLVTAEDMTINETLFPAAVTSYATGEVDKDTAIQNFKDSVHDTYSYLKTE
jgi:hypothetical protein